MTGTAPTGSAGPAARRRVLLVTGMSGAGKTSVLKSLEDIGFEAVDNIPLSLLASLVAPAQMSLGDGNLRPLAIGVDIRTRGFGLDALAEELDRLRDLPDVDLQVLFLDCGDAELHRRYVETRHRHPLAQDRPVTDGIKAERRQISPLRGRADVVLDTTGLRLGELKDLMRQHFGQGEEPGLTLAVTSFGFKRGLPREADLVFDVRFLANPHYDPTLRPLTGRDPQVAEFVAHDGGFDDFFANLTRLIAPLLPRYAAEGKSYLTIAVGCTGGRHRSVFVAERLAEWLAMNGHRVQLRHRDLEERDARD